MGRSSGGRRPPVEVAIFREGRYNTSSLKEVTHETAALPDARRWVVGRRECFAAGRPWASAMGNSGWVRVGNGQGLEGRGEAVRSSGHLPRQEYRRGVLLRRF